MTDKQPRPCNYPVRIASLIQVLESVSWRSHHLMCKYIEPPFPLFIESVANLGSHLQYAIFTSPSYVSCNLGNTVDYEITLVANTLSAFGLDTTLQKNLDQLPAVDIKHAPAKLPSKLHMFAYVDFLAQSLCSVHSECASKLG